MAARRAGNPQSLATRALCEVIERGRYLDAALEETAAKDTWRGLVAEMGYGATREWFRLDCIARALLSHPLKDRTVHVLLLVGLYQLRHMRTGAHAIVAETVEAAAHLHKPWAKGLLNACLRTYLRDPKRAEASIAHDIEARYNHPRWLIERLQTAYPQQWEAILAANNERPPMTLRVNALLSTRAEYLEKLSAGGIAACEAAGTEHGVVLATPCSVERLPGFADGVASVQDAAAQLAVPLLDVPKGARVLDACAAPGGKTGQLLEQNPGAEVVAVEIDEARARRIRQNLERLKLTARVVTADAGEPASWWDGRPFERILLDPPCSASGVIRRHPDIKLRRKPQELPLLMKTQARLLAALWPLLAPGGKLLYVTCSVLPEENELEIENFLARHPDAAALTLPLGRAQGQGRQVLPGEDGMDGFFFAALQKR